MLNEPGMSFDDFTKRLQFKGHALLPLEKPQALGSFLKSRLFDPFQRLSGHQLWGKGAREAASLGKKIGWVPDQIPFVFFTPTVIEEISLALADQEGLLKPKEIHLKSASILLRQLGIEKLAARSPWTLSTGESKLVWLLIQWCKSPQWLFIDCLPAGLSGETLSVVLSVFRSSKKTSPEHLILGFCENDTEWIKPLIKAGWQVLEPLNDLLK